MNDQEKAAKIVEMREGGFTWFQVDQVVFPGTTHEQSKKKSPSWHFSKKRNLPVFTKMVIGMYTPTQIVVQLRKFNPHNVAAAPAQMQCDFAM